MEIGFVYVNPEQHGFRIGFIQQNVGKCNAYQGKTAPKGFGKAVEKHWTSSGKAVARRNARGRLMLPQVPPGGSSRRGCSF